jgi:hypothetical protein
MQPWVYGGCYRGGVFRVFVLACLSLAACDGGIEVVVEVRSDLLPGDEFTSIETSLDGAQLTVIAAVTSDDYITGGRVAEFTDVPPGQRVLHLVLRDADGSLVVERDVQVDVDRSLGVTVVLARACRSLVCPDIGDVTQACHGGRCVPAECSSVNPAACGTDECATNSECSSTAPCLSTVCAEGVCFEEPQDGMCAATERCLPEVGCAPVDAPDSGPADSGTMDSAVLPDAATDADAGPSTLCPDDPRLRACYRFEGTLDDSSRYGHDLTSSMTPMFVPGAIGSGALIPSGALSTPSTSDLMHGGRTMELWVRSAAAESASLMNKDSAYFVRLNMGLPNCLLGVEGGPNVLTASLSDAVPPDTWAHIACTYDETDARLYLDGVEVAVSAVGLPSRLTTGPLFVGGSAPAGAARFRGAVDEVRIWSYARSPAEIMEAASAR